MSIIEYKPTGSESVEMAVTVALTSNEATTVRIYLRTITTVADPTTFITTNSLEHLVVSQAGLDEEAEFSAYSLVSSTSLGDYYYYVVDAAVSTS
jgi:hypothetical protein